MESLSQVMNKWREEGYDKQITFDESGNPSVEGKNLSKADVSIDKTERFEGNSNPSDMSILYAVSHEGEKLGIIVDNYDPKAESKVGLFLRDVQ